MFNIKVFGFFEIVEMWGDAVEEEEKKEEEEEEGEEEASSDSLSQRGLNLRDMVQADLEDGGEAAWTLA